MSLACKCDRCGALFELSNGRVKRIAISLIGIGNSYEGRPELLEKMDLCESCSDEMNSMLHKYINKKDVSK